MSGVTLAALAFALVTAAAIAFQLALALGAPWGALAMGGRFPGALPPPMRIAAVVQALVLAGLALTLLGRAGVLHLPWAARATWATWVIVGVSAVSLVLNTLTPSARERRLWAPVALVMLASSLVVALAT